MLRAVDSSSWGIASSSNALLDAFQEKYKVLIEAGDMSG